MLCHIFVDRFRVPYIVQASSHYLQCLLTVAIQNTTDVVAEVFQLNDHVIRRALTTSRCKWDKTSPASTKYKEALDCFKFLSHSRVIGVSCCATHLHVPWQYDDSDVPGHHLLAPLP